MESGFSDDYLSDVAMGLAATSDEIAMINHIEGSNYPLDEDMILDMILYNGNSQDQIELTLPLAHHIMSNNKYTKRGYKDYMYCYKRGCFSRMGSEDFFINTIASLVMHEDDVTKLCKFLYYYLGHMLCCESIQGKTANVVQWFQFRQGAWLLIEQNTVYQMFTETLKNNSIMNGLGSSDLVGMFNKLIKSKSSVLKEQFLYNKFRDYCDDYKIFAMSTLCFDLDLKMVRGLLPGDLCMLRGTVDCANESEWSSKRGNLLDALKSWMKSDDIVNTYLDCCSRALGEFEPRYAIVNYGTGADGKTTWLEILRRLWGDYSSTVPEKFFTSSSKDADGTTPVLTLLGRKRLVTCSDVADIRGLLTSTNFLTITGGDSQYERKLFSQGEAGVGNRRKCLILLNTNCQGVVATNVAQITRLNVVFWGSKYVKEEDVSRIPSHLIKNRSEAISRYVDKFMSEYGSILMTELLYRYVETSKNGGKITIAKEIVDFTTSFTAPQTMKKFLEECTIHEEEKEVKVNNNDIVEKIGNVELALSQTNNKDLDKEPSLAELYNSYIVWRKINPSVDSSTDRSYNIFEQQIGYFYTISVRKSLNIISNRTEEVKFIKGLRLKDSDITSYITTGFARRADPLNMMYQMGPTPNFPQLQQNINSYDNQQMNNQYNNYHPFDNFSYNNNNNGTIFFSDARYQQNTSKIQEYEDNMNSFVNPEDDVVIENKEKS